MTIQEHKTKVKPQSDKLISYLNSKGIEFIPMDGELNNVILRTKDKEVKMSHHSFYGYSRMGCVTKQKGEKANEFEFIEVTNEMFINNIMRSIIDFHFKD